MEDWVDILKIVASLAVIIALVGGIVWRVSAWKTGVDKDRETFKGDAEKDRSAIKGFMEEIRKDIKDIFLRLPDPLVSAQSPIGLTDLGQEISDELKAGDWAEEKAGEIVDQFQGKKPYEIQEASFDHAENQDNYPSVLISEIKMSAYNRGIDIENIKRVFGVKLRDALLDKLGLPLPE